jgi:hypothetical protein
MLPAGPARGGSRQAAARIINHILTDLQLLLTSTVKAGKSTSFHLSLNAPG